MKLRGFSIPFTHKKPTINQNQEKVSSVKIGITTNKKQVHNSRLNLRRLFINRTRRFKLTFSFAMLAAVIAVPAVAMLSASAATPITEFPGDSGTPVGITSGPDSNLWYVDQGTNSIVRMTPAGVKTKFLIPSNNAGAGSIANSGGFLWFNEVETAKIGRVNATTGVITEFTLPGGAVGPGSFTAGPDGNAWFTTTNAIGKITPTGTITLYPLPAGVSLNGGGVNPNSITTGPGSNGNLWFTAPASNQIGEITTTGTYTMFPLPAGDDPVNITSFFDGDLWFTEEAKNSTSVGRITTTGTVTEFPLPLGVTAQNITQGSDALYFTDVNDNHIGRIDFNHVITTYTIPTSFSVPYGITYGAQDGAMWFTEAGGTGNIGRLTHPPVIGYTITPSANTKGWYTAPVTITYSCLAAPTVTITSCPSPLTISTNGYDIPFSASTTDSTGQTASVTGAVFIDQTPPTVSTPTLSINPLPQGLSTTVTASATDAVFIAPGSSAVTGGEYYIGTTDPGVGLGKTMTWDGTHLTASIGSGLTPGTYPVNVRAQNYAGTWSPVQTITLNVVQPTPAAPTNLTAQNPTNLAPVLTWTASPNATSYNIYRGLTKVGTSTTTSFTDTSATPGSYQYTVTAVNGNSLESSHSNIEPVTYSTTPPNISYSLSPAANANGWNSTSVVVTFICSPATGIIPDAVTFCTAPVTVSTSGTNQQVEGFVTDSAGNSNSLSIGVNVDLTSPTVGTPNWTSNPATVGIASTVTATPTSAFSPIVKGEYYVGPTDPGVGHGSFMGWNGTTLSAITNFATPGTYVLHIRAQNAAGTWGPTTATTLVVNAPIAAAPTNLSAVTPTNQSPSLSWTPSAGATSYNVYRGNTLLTNVTSATYVDPSASQGNNSYSVTAVNTGGESSPSSTFTVDYDTVVPTISYTLSQPPIGAGWNNTQVTVTFQCNDADSGIFNCTSPQTLISDGPNQTVTGTATDNAGNTASVNAVINLDQTPPTTGTPSVGSSQIDQGNTTSLTATANDSLSGIAGGEYFIGSDPGNGHGTVMTWNGTDLTATFGSTLSPGTYQVNVRSEDVAGNWSSLQTVSLTVNPDAPAIPANLASPSPTNQSPKLSWGATDSATTYNVYRDGVKIGSPATNSFTDSTATLGTFNYTVAAVNAGGESPQSTPVSVVYDTAPPTISYSVSQPPNSNGWNNNQVTVTFNCSDATVGIASCTPPQTVTADGKNQTVTGTAVNKAGTSAQATATINIDEAAPTLGSPAWNTNPITSDQSATLTVPASDALSGVTGGEFFVGSDPGVGQGTPMTWDGTKLTASFSSLPQGTFTVNFRAEDAAGNWSPAQSFSLTVNNPIPASPQHLNAQTPTSQSPALTWDITTNATSYNVYRNGVNVGSSTTNSYTDNSATPGSYIYTVSAVNVSGESSQSSPTTVVFDTTPPTITYQLSGTPNGAGWFNNQVTVTFTCHDPTVGMFSCTGPQTLISDGANQTVTGSALNNAGVSAMVSATINLDQTAPTLGSPSWSVNPSLYGQTTTLNVAASDVTSGVVGGEYYIGTDPGNGHGTAMTLNGSTLSAPFNLAPGSYDIYYRTEDAAGNWNTALKTTLIVSPIAAPTGLNAVTPTNSAPVLTWNTVSTAASYNVYRNSILIGNAPTPTFTDTSAPQAINSYTVATVSAYGSLSTPSSSFSVRYDTTPPTISYTLSPVPNGAGWENSPVKVSFTCNDANVAVTACTSPVTLSTNGKNQQVTGTATDAAGNSASVTASVNIDQSAPSVATPTWSANPITAGQSATVTAATNDTFSGVVGGEYYIGSSDPGNGHATAMTLTGGNLTAVIGSSLSAGTYQVNIRAQDAAGNWSTTQSTSLVINPATTAPAITSGASATANVGTAFSFTVTATGLPLPSLSESGALPSGITLTDNGNGTATLAGTAAAGTSGTYPMTITATNTAGHVNQSFTLNVSQGLVISSVTSSTAPVPIGQSISATANFTDTSSSAAHTVVWNWGDGSTSTSAANAPSVTATHTFVAAGVYTINATITNQNGLSVTNAYEYVVVYNPSGGFVTGGGWINSPAGAFTANPTLTGKATFGFVSKYEKGASVPTGSTDFQFQLANFEFQSTSYSWLVIAGSKAQYKGTGTINGQGSYDFMLTATDGNPDKFRLKVWDPISGNVLYDNQTGAGDNADPTTAIGGGSIVLHS